MTIDRIAPERGITAAQLNSVTAVARLACQAIPPFRIRLGELSGTRGAIGFTVTPVAPISQLRDTLRAATLSVRPDAAATREEMIPHSPSPTETPTACPLPMRSQQWRN